MRAFAAMLCALALAGAPGAGRSQAAFDGVVIERALTGAEAATATATMGARVRLVISSDERAELHLHGYDMAAVAAPGAPAVFEFDAVHGGRFAVVRHGGHDLLGRHEAPVLYLEVRAE